MEVWLVRHGEPRWVRDGLIDEDPILTERGRRQAAWMADRLSAVSPDELWVSPARRARETARPLAQGSGLTPKTRPWLLESRPPRLDGADLAGMVEMFRASRRRPVAGWWEGTHGSEPPRAFIRRVTEGLEAELARHGAARREVGAGPDGRDLDPGPDGLDPGPDGLDAGPGPDGLAAGPPKPDRLGPDRLDRGQSSLWDGVPRDGRLAIVSHAGTSAVLLSCLLGLPQVAWSWERFHLPHAGLARLRTTAIADGVIFKLFSFGDVEHIPMSQRTV